MTRELAEDFDRSRRLVTSRRTSVALRILIGNYGNIDALRVGPKRGADGERLKARISGMREDVIGRANVEDTPELDAYYCELGRQQSYALWTVANSIEPWQPQPTSLPTLWSYAALRPLVLQALELVSPEKAGRRVIALENPGRKGLSACVGWLYTGLQVMRPGEFATAHNHASSALRFIMEGAGAYTVVDGHKMSLGGRRFRHHAERHLARSRRRGRRRDHDLAGRPRHAAGQSARRQFLRGASRARAEVELPGERYRLGLWRPAACCRWAARPGASRIRRCSSTNGVRPTTR